MLTLPLPTINTNKPKNIVQVPIICGKCTYIVDVDKKEEKSFWNIFNKSKSKLKRLGF